MSTSLMAVRPCSTQWHCRRRTVQITHSRPVSLDEPAPNYWAKAELVVRAKLVSTIQVDQLAHVARVGWGSPADFGSVVTTAGCDGEGWMAFAGDFLVDEPAVPI